MKRIASVFILFALLLSLLVSCAGEDVSGPEQTDESSVAESGAEPVSEESSEEESKPMVPDENAKLIWQERFADPDSGLGSPDDIYGADYYFDGALISDYSRDHKSGDSRFVFRGKENSRVVNFADGYMLTVPYADVACDLSLGEFRTKLVTSEAVINITYEDQNPYYKNGASGWETYLTEWLVPRIDDLDFLNANNIMRSSCK